MTYFLTHALEIISINFIVIEYFVVPEALNRQLETCMQRSLFAGNLKSVLCICNIITAK